MSPSVLWFLLTGSLLTANAALATPPSSSLTLSQAIEVGLENNAALRVTIEEYQKQKARWKEAIGQTTPRISGSLSYFRTKDADASERARFSGHSFNLYEGEVKASQILFQRGFFEAIASATKQKTLSEVDLALAKRSVTQSIINAFYQVTLQEQLIIILRHLKNIQEQSLGVARHRSRTGRGQELDVLQIQTQLALLEPKIQRAESDLIRAREELGFTIGDRHKALGTLNGSLDLKRLHSLAQNIKASAASKVLELERFEIERQKLLSELTVTLGKHWPQLSADASLGRSGYHKGSLVDNDATRWSVGLTLQIPLFHGLSYFFERQALESSLSQLDARERQQRDEISKNQIIAEQNLITALSAADSSQRAYELATRALDLARQDYRVANVDYMTLLGSEKNLFDAEQSLEQAKYDSMARLVDYSIAKGHDLNVISAD